MQQQAITLLTLNELIRKTLDENLSPSYWVMAEIGEFRDSVKGHAYLDLIEKTDETIRAKMRANIWSYTYQSIKRKFESVTGEKIRSGMMVLALVNVQFHELYGLSLIIKDIDPHFTLGERARKRQEIIEKLQVEGLLDLNKQFVLPAVSQKVAIISSVTAAGYGDFINQLDQNGKNYKVHYRLYQASIQGNEAVRSIIAAIHEVEQHLIAEKFDLLVIIRGGGAQTDMDCFDDYALAQTIANAALPVVTGIGHERDQSIADMVAHTQLKTPTAVATFILSGFSEFEEHLNSLSIRMERVTKRLLQNEHNYLKDQSHLIRTLASSKLGYAKQMMDGFSKQTFGAVKHHLNLQQIRIGNIETSIRKITFSLLVKEKERLTQFDKTIKRLNPEYILTKGYTRTEINGMPINLQELKINDRMATFTKKQKIYSIIETIEDHDKKK
ncbi:MAG: exodeoxyribonuclease VII large subunit [Cyclobacteriaceae bacterium]